MIALVVRKLSIGGSKPTIMSGELRIDLQAKAEQRAVYPSGSPSHPAISPTGLSSFLPTISSRFNVGKSKDPTSASVSKSKKKKSKLSSSTISAPTQGKPTHALSEISPQVLKEWEVSFSALLKHPDGLELFEGFLVSEFSEENIQFWKACEHYRTVPDHMLEKEATIIYEEYIAPQAPKLVNIDHQTTREIVDNMKVPNRSSFSRAQQSIYLLMARDSFVRFVKSEQFQSAFKRNKH